MAGAPRTAIQLYSLRSHPESLPDIVRRVATRGYDGVEFADRFHREPVEDIAAALADTGIEPVAAHASLSAIEDALGGESDLLERCESVGCDRLVVPHLNSTHFRTRESLRALADRLTDAAAALDERGLELGLHNDRSWLRPLLPDGVGTVLDATPVPELAADYAQEAGRRFQARHVGPVHSQTPLWHLIARTEPDAIGFEVEVAELRAGGVDPAEALSVFDGRAEMLHLRDVVPGSGFDDYEHVPHGEGVLDMERILAAADDDGVEWLVYENELAMDDEAKIDAGRRFFDRVGDRQATTTEPAPTVHREAA